MECSLFTGNHVSVITVLIVIAGESGLGKSTLVNTLFLHDLYEERNYPSAKGVYIIICSLYHKAQNKDRKLVSHSLKVGAPPLATNGICS